jgi:tRNA threonylcarbamoyladenosine biosynthesis protein TsaE
MQDHSLTFATTDPIETADIAARLGRVVACGDVILLVGDIGAGKTHFARHLIQSLQDVAEDVPSPSFTLVQTYDTRAGDIWHADLYRLTSPSEVEELGLADAFGTAICLVEWPDRLGELQPPDALTVEFRLGPDETDRILIFQWTSPRWSTRLKKI